MSKNSEAVKRWRRNAKRRLIRAFGGACCVCGYDKCDEALEFHHLDPAEKETSWSSIRGCIKGWATIVREMVKCVLVCSNCHKEIHAGAATVPSNAPRFDPAFIEYKEIEKQELYDECPVCSKQKLKHYNTCSKKCAASRKLRVEWNKYDLNELLRVHKTYEAVGDMLGVSGAAVSRKVKQLQTGKW